MPTTVDCPACRRKLRVPDRLHGKQVKCPECGDTFASIPGLDLPPASVQPETLVYPPDANPLAGSQAADLPAPSPPAREMNPNPRAESAPARLEDEEDSEEDRWESRGVRRDSEPHRGQTVITMGVISVVCGGISMVGCPFLGVFGLGLGIPTWVMGHKDLKKMHSGIMDSRGEAQTRTGLVCGIVGTILSILGLLLLAFLIALEVWVFVNLSSAMSTQQAQPSMQTPAPVPGEPKGRPEEGR
jgi:hypothetical protein